MPLQALPIDIRVKILQMVGTMPDLMRARSVCRDMYRIIMNKKYQCIQCQLVLREWRSDPDDLRRRLTWESKQSQIILWYSFKPVSGRQRRQIEKVMGIVQSIQIDRRTIIDIHRSTTIMHLIFQGKYPSPDDFKIFPLVVRHHCPPTVYPLDSDLAFVYPNRLTEISGLPRRIPMLEALDEDEDKFDLSERFWRNGAVIFPCDVDLNDYILDRGMDTNENGWLAILTERDELSIFRPHDHQFCLAASLDVYDYGLQDGPHRVRVRYRQDFVYVFAHFCVHTFRFDDEEGVLEEFGPTFQDDYAMQQRFADVDVHGRYLVAIWRKWCGFYKVEDFSWFHAVSICSAMDPPKSMRFVNGFLHVSTGSSILAFHAASRNPTVLWVNGNLPKSTSRDVPFCVSASYGVFSVVCGDIVQSLYEARTAQCVYGDKATLGDGLPSPTPFPQKFVRGRHIVHKDFANSDMPYQTTELIEYDESFGRHGRLLCYDETKRTIFMTVNRSEFDELIKMFAKLFGRFAPVDDMINGRMNDHWIDWFCAGQNLEVELSDVGWKECVIEKIYSNGEATLRVDYGDERKPVRKSLLHCRSRCLVAKLSETEKSKAKRTFVEFTRDYGETLVQFMLEQSLGLFVRRCDGAVTVRFRLLSL